MAGHYRKKHGTVFDLWERNANTFKLVVPLSAIDGILRRVASHRWYSIFDLQAAYEQIHVISEHVPRTAATCQALMNHIFSAHLGVFVDVYLDDIVVYSDSLSEKKCHVLAAEISILGHIVDRQGIRMDPVKVDSVVAWKVPTNRDLLRTFLGSVGYLADDVASVRIPMGVLHGMTGNTVQDFREHRRVPLDYAKDAPNINLVTDACATGISGVISQGNDWHTASVAAFFSAKLKSAQQNYPVHELEMFVGVETMRRYRDISSREIYLAVRLVGSN